MPHFPGTLLTLMLFYPQGRGLALESQMTSGFFLQSPQTLLFYGLCFVIFISYSHAPYVPGSAEIVPDQGDFSSSQLPV